MYLLNLKHRYDVKGTNLQLFITVVYHIVRLYVYI